MRNKTKLEILLILVVLLLLELMLYWHYESHENGEEELLSPTVNASVTGVSAAMEGSMETGISDVTETTSKDTESEATESIETEPKVTETPAAAPPATEPPVTNSPVTDPSEDDGVMGEFDTPIG